jgi:hypothetical protein
VTESAVVISHPNPTWPGARNIHTTQDGHLLCITRQVLFDTCLRLKEEHLADDQTMVIVRDASDAAPDVAGRVADVLNHNYGAHATARSPAGRR